MTNLRSSKPRNFIVDALSCFKNNFFDWDGKGVGGGQQELSPMGPTSIGKFHSRIRGDAEPLGTSPGTNVWVLLNRHMSLDKAYGLVLGFET